MLRSEGWELLTSALYFFRAQTFEAIPWWCDFHFIACSCFHRRQFLKSARRRDIFLKLLEEVRHKYQFTVAGYVVMPEHFHLLIGEPALGSVSTVMQVLKPRSPTSADFAVVGVESALGEQKRKRYPPYCRRRFA
jgi:hypothetical protein